MTSREILHAIKFGLIDEAIHPIAESIIVAETALKTYEQTGASLVSPLFYLVLTLRDIAKSRSLIPGSEPRIQKLMGTEWQSALHELIIACSYLPHPQPELLPESETPTPDIRLKTEPIVYVECKARLKYEQEVIAFTDTWRRESLATIKKIIGEYTCSFVIRVVIRSPQSVDAYRSEIPQRVKEMIETGINETRVPDRFEIKIEPWAAEIVKLSRPMSPNDRALWRFSLEFNEWDDWHYLSPDANLEMSEHDSRLAISVGKRAMVCVRAEYLKDNRISLLNTLKDACKRQLREHSPGIIYVWLNASLFGLGDLRRPEVIQSVLTPEIQNLFSEYSRVWRVVIDLMIEREAEGDNIQVTANRFVATNPRLSATPQGYIEPKSVLLI